MTGGIYNRCVARRRLLIGGQCWAPVQYKDRKGAATGRSDQSGERSMSQIGMEGTNWDVTLTFDHVYGNLHVKKCSHNPSTHLKTNKICQFCFLSLCVLVLFIPEKHREQQVSSMEYMLLNRTCAPPHWSTRGSAGSVSN